MKRSLLCLSSGALACALAACAATPPRPAYITHVVLKLDDPTRADELLADSEGTLARVPGIAAFAAGRHIDIGRPEPLGDYDVAFYMGFDSVEDYRAYNAHPDHVRIRDKWRPRFESIRIFDFADPTP